MHQAIEPRKLPALFPGDLLAFFFTPSGRSLASQPQSSSVLLRKRKDLLPLPLSKSLCNLLQSANPSVDKIPRRDRGREKVEDQDAFACTLASFLPLETKASFKQKHAYHPLLPSSHGHTYRYRPVRMSRMYGIVRVVLYVCLGDVYPCAIWTQESPAFCFPGPRDNCHGDLFLLSRRKKNPYFRSFLFLCHGFDLPRVS